MTQLSDASVPTPSPEMSRTSTRARYRREEFPPAPKSVRLVEVSRDADSDIATASDSAGESYAETSSVDDSSSDEEHVTFASIALVVVGLMVLLRSCGAVGQLAWRFIEELPK